MYKICSAVLLLMLTGCASTVPDAIRIPPPGNPPVDEVRAKPQGLTGAEVRWGGAIASVENRAEETWIEIVSRELSKEGRPGEQTNTRGRFLARIQGFLDPAVYAPGRLLTVKGRVESQTTRLIGGYTYTYPVVAVSDHYLWEALAEPPPPPYYHYYDPFWYPYDPWFYPRYYPRHNHRD